MVRNWKYFTKKDEIGLLKITKGQFMTGNIMGIISDKKAITNSEGHLLNAKTYDFPVRIKLVDEYDQNNYPEIARQIHDKICELESEGCRFIITTGEKLGLFDKILHETQLLVISTPMAAVDLAAVSIASDEKVCIINPLSVDENIAILHELGIEKNNIARCIFTDKDRKGFWDNCGNVITENLSIGSYIWDYREDGSKILAGCGKPIYNMRKLSEFVKNTVLQLPYEGVI